MKTWIAAFAMIASSQAMAELPPFYQSTNEISAVLEMEDLAEVMNPDSIQRIKRKNMRGELYYQVESRSCDVLVKVNKLPTESEWAGPTPFSLDLITAKCR